MAALFIAILASLATLGFSLQDTNLTVTHESWFEIEMQNYDGPGDDFRGKIVIGLFGTAVPMTVLNFHKLTNGYERAKDSGRKEKLHYKNTHFHRIIQDFVVQGGDVQTNDGTGGKSIFGENFIDENFFISHRAAGYVSMANHGKDTNNSQFFIILNKSRWLDDKHVVLGKVVSGMDFLKAMGDAATVEGTAKPKHKIKIVDCGSDELESKKQYILTSEQADSEEDIISDD